MDSQRVERRRVPRGAPVETHRVSVHGSMTVRVIDFSQSGVMVASKLEVGAGDHAALSVVGREHSARVPIQIRHVSMQPVPGAGDRFCAGAMVLAPSPDQRERLNVILRAERS